MQLTHTNGHKRTDTKRPEFNQITLYEQVRNYIAEQIETGKWAVGTNLPNEPDLARDLGVSNGTIRNALGMLESEGVISRKQGRGTMVLDKRANDQQRKLACIKKSLLVIKAAVEDAGQNTTPKLQSSLQTHIAEALYSCGFSGEAP